MVMAQYVEESEVVFFIQSDSSEVHCHGVKGIAECHKTLFATMTTPETIEYVHGEEKSGEHPADGLVVFSIAKSGYKEATTSFIGDVDGKIWRQYTVMDYDGNGIQNSSAGGNSLPSLNGPFKKTVSEHSDGFKARNLTAATAHYTEDSVVTIYNQADYSVIHCMGLLEIWSCHKRLFDSMSTAQTNNFLHVEEEKSAEHAATAFLVFIIPGSGYKRATSTFIADETSRRIYRQNTVVNYVGDVNITASLIPSPSPGPTSGVTGLNKALVIKIVVFLFVFVIIGVGCCLLAQKRRADKVQQANLALLTQQMQAEGNSAQV